jgi:PAS domain S-box-containing protein
MGKTKFLLKKQLLKLVDRLPGTIFQYREWPDKRSTFPYSNSAIEEIFFATPKELAKDGNLAWSRITEKSATELRKILDMSAFQLEVFQAVILTNFPQDRAHWIRIHAVPERLRDGSTLWHGHMENITAQHEAEEAAKQKTALLNVIFENLEDHFYYKDTKGRLLGANATCYRYHGFRSEAEIKGKTDQELYPGEQGKEGFDLEQSIMKSGKTHREREKHINDDGSIIYLESLKSSLRSKSGRIIGLAGISRDITSQVEHEEQLIQAKQDAEQSASFIRAIFDNLEDRFYYKDRQSHILGGNKAWIKSMGASAIEELLGKTDIDMHPAPLGQQLFDNEQRQMADDEVMRIRERHTLPDGTVEYLEAVKCPMKNDQGEIIGLAGISRNITKQVENEKHLIAAQLESEEANKAKSSFLAMMSHEIRTPMNGVIGAASLLLGTKLSEPQEEFVHTIQVSGENLMTIINDILDYSKIEAGKIDMESVPFNLRECMEDAFDLFTQAAAKKNLELLCDVEPDVPECLRGDPTRLRQVVVNLLGNAIKFTEKGEVSVQVSLSLRNEKSASCQLQFAVRDTGIGISEEAQKRLFQSFTQADVSSTRKYGGTGLGLVISRRLTELMGGEIWLESEEGKGSIFRFTTEFPIASMPEKKVAPTFSEQLKGKRVLIVDDNETNRKILATQMEQWEAIPELFSHPELVIEHLKQAPPYDIILLDFHMPVMDGAELAKSIYKLPNYPSTPIMILSSSFEIVPPHPSISSRMAKPIKMSKLQQQMLLLLNQERQTGKSQNHTGSHHRSKKKLALRILVAEDNPINQRVAQMMLQRLGCENAVFVEDGREAVAAVIDAEYDVVLMDVQMPHMNGLDATTEIRKHIGKKDEPWIIALTAGVMEDERKKIMQCGMNDFLAKPMAVDQLEKRLLTVNDMINSR